MSSARRFASRSLFLTLLVSVTGCFALFPLDDYQDDNGAADAGGDGSTQSGRDATLADGTDPSVDTGPPGSSRIVFVSNNTYNAKLGGLEGADQVCAELAKKANLAGTFKALLSGEAQTTVMAVRFGLDGASANGAIVDRRGGTLAESYARLLADGPATAILYDERGLAVPGTAVPDAGTDSVCATAMGAVWTNFSGDGKTESGVDCTDWTIDNETSNGRVGFANDRELWRTACRLPCSEKAHLYCGQL